MSAGGATFYAGRAQLQAWFAAARPGESAIYATGPALDPANETVRAVAGWRDGGLVTCVQQRGADRVLRYKIKVIRESLSVDRANVASGSMPPVSSELPKDWAFRPEGALYRLIVARAEAGLPCPSHAEIAEALDIDSRARVRGLLARVITSGALRVVAQPPRRPPVIEIAATGKRTGWSKGRERG